MNVGDFGLSIIVNGEVVPEFSGPDADTWIAARRGAAFSLLLTNLSGRRVEAVPAIDGLSATSGQPFGPASVGYLVRPQSQIVVPGWRLDNGHVARFEFGTAAAGYTRQTGQSTRAVGGISSAFFSERVWSVEELRAEVRADVTVCATCQSPGFVGPYTALKNMAKDRQDIWIRAEVAGIGEAGCLLAAARLLCLLPPADGKADTDTLLTWGNKGHVLAQYLLGRSAEQIPTFERLRVAEQWYQAAGKQGMFEARGKAIEVRKIIQAMVQEMLEAERRRAEAEKRVREEAERRAREEAERRAKSASATGNRGTFVRANEAPARIESADDLRAAFYAGPGDRIEQLRGVMYSDGTMAVADANGFQHTDINRYWGEGKREVSRFFLQQDRTGDVVAYFPDGTKGVANHPAMKKMGFRVDDESMATVSSPDRGVKFSIASTLPTEGDVIRAVERPGIWSSVKRWLLADAVPESKAGPAASGGVPSVTDSEQYTENVAVVFGKQIEHRVRPLQFRRASAKPDAFIGIRYDTARGLTGRGIGCPVPKGWQAGQ